MWASSREAGDPWSTGERPGEAMVHDHTTYMDDEGIEYVALGGEDEESGSIIPVHDTAGGRMWGADEAWGGYEAE